MHGNRFQETPYKFVLYNLLNNLVRRNERHRSCRCFRTKAGVLVIASTRNLVGAMTRNRCQTIAPRSLPNLLKRLDFKALPYLFLQVAGGHYLKHQSTRTDRRSSSESNCINRSLHAKVRCGISYENKGNGVTVLLKDAVRYKPVFDAMLKETATNAKSIGYANEEKIIDNKKRTDVGENRAQARLCDQQWCGPTYRRRRGSIIFDNEATLRFCQKQVCGRC